MTNVNPIAISVVRATEEAHKLRFFSQEYNRNNIYEQRQQQNSQQGGILWYDTLLFPDDSQPSSPAATTTAATSTPLVSFTELCDRFTQVQPLADQVARHFYGVSSPCTVALVQARQDASSSSSATSSTDSNNNNNNKRYRAGDTLWCLLVAMPPGHVRKTAAGGAPADLVIFTLTVFIFPHESVHALDSVIACCVNAARSVDSLVGGHNNDGRSSASAKAVGDAIAQLGAVASSVPRDIAAFLPLDAAAWSGAARPPHAMIPLGHFVQTFDYPILLQLFSLACQEASIVFTHTSTSIASQCAVALRGLLYPLAWPHSFQPMVPASKAPHDWPFPLSKTSAALLLSGAGPGERQPSSPTGTPLHLQLNTAFIAGVALRDLPALLIDHANAAAAAAAALFLQQQQQLPTSPKKSAEASLGPLELWIVDCRTGSISRAARKIKQQQQQQHYICQIFQPTIVNHNLPSSLSLRECWERARLSLARVAGSPREHIRIPAEVRQELLTTMSTYWAEHLLGQYRMGLSLSRSVIDLDAFLYKLLQQGLSEVGSIDADPDGTIRALSFMLRRSSMIGNGFVKNMFSLEKLANVRVQQQQQQHQQPQQGGSTSVASSSSSGEEIHVLPFWKWGMSSASRSSHPVSVKEQHDFYFFFRRCCDKFPEMYREDPVAAAKLKDNSGFMSKVGGFFAKAKESAKAIVADYSLGKHFSLSVPYLSEPKGGLLALLVAPSDEKAAIPQFLQQQHQQSINPNGVTHSIQTAGNPNFHRSAASQQQQYQNQSSSQSWQFPPDNAKIEAHCRHVPPSLSSEHWMNLYPHVKQAFAVYESLFNRREEQVLAAPLPLDALCDFGTYHSMLAPEPLEFHQHYHRASNGSNMRQGRDSNNNNSAAAAAAPALLKQISLPTPVSSASPTGPVIGVVVAATAASPLQPSPVVSPSSPSPSVTLLSSAAADLSLFNKISVPRPSASTPLQQQQQQQQQTKTVEEAPADVMMTVPAPPVVQPQLAEASMAALFGPKPGEPAAVKKDPKLDDFF